MDKQPFLFLKTAMSGNKAIIFLIKLKLKLKLKGGKDKVVI
jgi:hypothetical protein